MSSISMLADADVRAAAAQTPARAPADEPRSASENNFQDAVDARRAERARSSAKDADVREGREREERVQGRDERSGETEERSESAAESEPGESEEQAHANGADADEARSVRDESGDPRRVAGEAASRGATRAHRPTEDASSSRSTPTKSDARADALGVPWLAHTALEALLARALPHAAAAGSSATPAGSAGAVSGASGEAVGGSLAPASHGRSERTAAPQETPTALALSIDALPLGATEALGDPGALASQPAARADASPALAAEARGALAAFAAPTAADAATDLAAPRAPIAARVTPAELPSFLEHLAVRIDAPERSAVVHLEPAELGRLTIALSLEPGGHVRAELRAERQDGYAALAARVPELQASFVERGFASASVNLSLGLADPHSRRSGAESRASQSTSGGRRTLADAEVQALLRASPHSPHVSGAIDMWA